MRRDNSRRAASLTSSGKPAPYDVLNRLARGVRVAANHGPIDEVTDADR